MSTVIPTYKTIKVLLKGEKFAIDDYQREYAWETTQIVELLDDLRSKFLSSYKANHETSAVAGYEDYFLGSIIISKRDGKNYLIDGQQRTTSLTLLLIYLYHHLKEHELAAANTLGELIYSDNYGKASFNLDIPERTALLEALFHKQPFDVSDKDESVQTMAARYEDIENEFPVEDITVEALENFTYWLIEKVGIIEIATTSDDYAYTIFETMNDRGKPLSPTDMLKAHILGRIENNDKRKLANEQWRVQIHELLSIGKERQKDRDSNFIRDWLRAQYAQDTRERKAGASDKDWEQIGSAFHRWVRDNKHLLKLEHSQDYEAFITKHFPFYAHVYETIHKASQSRIDGLESIYYNAVNDFTLQNTVLLAPIRIDDDELTRKKKLQATATYLDIFITRRVSNYIRVSYSNVQYTMFQLMKAIRQKPLDELVDILVQRLKEDDVTFDQAKNGQRNGLQDLRLNNFTKKYIHYILARLTSYLEEKSDRPVQFENYMDKKSRNLFEVEHILASTLDWQDNFSSEDDFQSNRNRISALVLLPKDINASLQDKPYSHKVEVYGNQNILAASLFDGFYQNNPRVKRLQEQIPLKSFEQFDLAEQNQRHELYDVLIREIWHPDRVRDVVLK